jgi:amino acid adenylation domain-containing protein
MKAAAIEDVLTLSPLQQGILFQTLYSPDSGMYVEQLSFTLSAPIASGPFQKAWQKVVERHAALRTSFYWEDVEQPVQVVQRGLDMPVQQEDWSGLDGAEQLTRLQAFLTDERRRGFDLSKAPLMRVTVIKLAESSCQLILSLHHIIMDGWSLAVVFQEVSAYYESYSQMRELELASSPPYGNYIAWLQLQDETAAETYWRRTLAGYTGPAPLCVDRGGGRLTEQDEVSEQQQVIISIETTAALRAVGREHRLTLNTLVQGVWALLLSRYTGVEDVVFGATVSGRPAVLDGVESMVGLFINTLPVRVRVPPHDLLIPWLKQLQADQLEARQYDYSPLAKIQSWSDAPRGVPLFHTLLAFENYPRTAASANRDVASVIRKLEFFEGNDYPLSVTVDPGDTLTVKVAYVQHRFEPVTISRLLGHFRMLLEGVAADPGKRLEQLPFLTGAEKRQLAEEWNDTAADYPRDARIHELFEAQVHRTPDAIAMIFGHQRLTYRELNQRSNQLAHYLRKRGVWSETLVAICMERSQELVIGILGILKAGGAYVPMDPAYPMAHRAFMLADAGPCALLTSSHLQASFDYRGTIVCPDEEADSVAKEPVNAPPGEGTAESLAYVVYTSGSTGSPKGVLVEHRALVNHGVAMANCYRLAPGDRVLQFAPIAFDVFAEELFPALLRGAAVVLRPEAVALSLTQLHECIATHQISVLNLPASYWHEWVSDLAHSGDHPPACVRLVVVGNERVLPERWNEWRALAGSIQSRNAYGPTEATVTATVYEPATHADKGMGASVPIGRPIANAQVYILDRMLEPLPIGVPGEIYIGGDGLARGYLNQPAVTAAKFIPHPFRAGARLYKTGDIGRYLPDANIEFLGRTDNQVKIRGHRVELEELESALIVHPSVQACAVAARGDESGRLRLIAYVVPSPGKPELWPSIGEYFLYDPVMYHAMTHDDERNRAYRVAISRQVKNKVVLDIGTGADAILARICIDAGARRVYAIEKLDASYEHAKDLLVQLGLDDRIILLHGEATKIQLPEPVDVCVSELLGMIGSSEGVIPILNNARRFLKDGGVMIPSRCTTKIAAVSLPGDLATHPRFTELSGPYVQKIFEAAGNPLDVRVCIRNFPESNVVSDAQVFEDLDFSRVIDTELRSEITLTITQNARIDGFLLWLNLFTIDDELIDSLHKEYNWLPVFFPAFSAGIHVSAGDIIRAVCSVGPSDCDATPDYRVEGTVIRKGGETVPFDYQSFHSREIFKKSRFHQALFADGWESRFAPLVDLAPVLRAFLKDRLPDYLTPSSFVMLKALPTLPTGKVDRGALPSPGDQGMALHAKYVAPRTPLEGDLAGIWSEILNVRQIGVDDNFFLLGGHSLLAMRVISGVRGAFQVELPLRVLFESPTVAGLARSIQEQQVKGPARPITPLTSPASVEELSDEEVNRMLSDILKQRPPEQTKPDDALR